MKKMYYILNSKTDYSFDPIENKFYPNNWEPELDDDKDYLQSLIDQDPEKFENCKFVKCQEAESSIKDCGKN